MNDRNNPINLGSITPTPRGALNDNHLRLDFTGRIIVNNPEVVDWGVFQALDRKCHGLMSRALAIGCLADDFGWINGYQIAEGIKLIRALNESYPGDLVRQNVTTMAEILKGDGPRADEMEILEKCLPTYLYRDARWTLYCSPGSPNVVTYTGCLGKGWPYSEIHIQGKEGTNGGICLPAHLKVIRYQDMDQAENHSEFCLYHYWTNDMGEDDAIAAAAAMNDMDPEEVSLDCNCESQVEVTRYALMPDKWEYKDEKVQEGVARWIELALWSDKEVPGEKDMPPEAKANE